MSRVVVLNQVTLDGVMQGPGRPDEDTRDGFEHGGWAVPGNDDVTYQAMVLTWRGAGGCCLGAGATRTC